MCKNTHLLSCVVLQEEVYEVPDSDDSQVILDEK